MATTNSNGTEEDQAQTGTETGTMTAVTIPTVTVATVRSQYVTDAGERDTLQECAGLTHLVMEVL